MRGKSRFLRHGWMGAPSKWMEGCKTFPPRLRIRTVIKGWFDHARTQETLTQGPPPPPLTCTTCATTQHTYARVAPRGTRLGNYCNNLTKYFNRGLRENQVYCIGPFVGSPKNELLRYLCAEDTVCCAEFLVSRDGVYCLEQNSTQNRPVERRQCVVK